MAMDTRAEELLLTIETTLYKVTETKLKETADYLKVSDTEGLSKRALLRTIHEHLDGLCEAKKDYTEDLHTSLEDILAFLCGTLHPWKTHRTRIKSYWKGRRKNTTRCKRTSSK